ncbi:unnamed protein product [Haemonchus placei]|uniref:Protein MAIN-LIKE 1-like n=1 Tax=Haemonchus placei TaxID=6290 RepID=A0A0N4VZB5_HAEPC|nr:unnamed protein product [Haemonchus placei]
MSDLSVFALAIDTRVMRNRAAVTVCAYEGTELVKARDPELPPWMESLEASFMPSCVHQTVQRICVIMAVRVFHFGTEQKTSVNVHLALLVPNVNTVRCYLINSCCKNIVKRWEESFGNILSD